MSCTSPDPPAYCSAASPELKLYQAFIFSVPVFFTFVLLLVFYLFYLRRWRASWQSLRMRANHLSRGDLQRPSETGIKKEVREMLPVIVFKESFLIRETQCSVCLGEYQSDERLQRIPPCGHTFHVDCIDHWLATNTTCPLCRVSLLPTPKAAKSSPLHDEDQAVEEENSHEEYTERLTSERTAQHENETEEREADNTVGETEEVRHQGEASLVVNVDP
ncbi:RING-H2 finger protein ATL58-like [Ananas comosus]|uniref:RING-type E3 ubiquitin transferase n=1 Tax=Ananas comosus TaxID=4615 RepID=A0A6P5GNJ2_ANACO|nr:RING-H2 finger protein ATL58-like [Ananas comosus]